MQMYSFSADHPDLLKPIARKFLEVSTGRGIYFVEGEMGAGKTTLIAAICEALDLSFQGSPTFSLVNEYTFGEDRKLYHFDLYRLKNAHEALDMGIEEYLDPENLVLIEWPDVLETLIHQPVGHVKIEDTGGVREIKLILP